MFVGKDAQQPSRATLSRYEYFPGISRWRSHRIKLLQPIGSEVDEGFCSC